MTIKWNADTTAKTIKAHIEKAEFHNKKSQDHEVSAACLLVEAKKELGHGNYVPWLKKHDIAPRTASRLIAEHNDPAKRAARMTKQNEKAKNERNKAAKNEEKEAKAAKQAEEDPTRTNVLRVIGGLDTMAIMDVWMFLVDNGFADTDDAPEMDLDGDEADDMEDAA